MFSDVLLTVDFDRTLTATDSTIPQRNLDAIRYFMENGGSFTVNTGRSIPMFLDKLHKVPTNAPLLLYNGSGDCAPGPTTLTRTALLDLDPAKVLPELQQRFPNLTVEVQGTRAHYTIQENPAWVRYCEHNHCAWGYAPADNLPDPFIKFAIYGQFRDETVASLYDTTPEEEAETLEMIAYLQERYGDKVDIFRACARITDVHAKGVSKGNAARDLKKQLGKKILVCVGDAENDLAMLQGADYAFCPADGVVAHLFPNVCPCDEGAVADVIYKKIPEILGICP